MVRRRHADSVSICTYMSNRLYRQYEIDGDDEAHLACGQQPDIRLRGADPRGAVRAGNLEQPVRMAEGFATRVSFLTDMTLDPPQATSDLAGAPLPDKAP